MSRSLDALSGFGNGFVTHSGLSFQGQPMTASPAMLQAHPGGQPQGMMPGNPMGNPMNGMLGQQPMTMNPMDGQMLPPGTMTPRMSHMQNPQNTGSPGLRQQSATPSNGVPPGSNYNQPGQTSAKRKATVDGSQPDGPSGPADGQGPPQRRQRTSGSVSNGSQPPINDNSSDTADPGVNTRTRGRKTSPATTKAAAAPKGGKRR